MFKAKNYLLPIESIYKTSSTHMGKKKNDTT